ncbi:MAG: deoxyribodipyrimidine photo-lyase [Chitinophagales bacterium]
MLQPISVFWFRRDLRLHDNAGLFHALKSADKVLPVFIFDTEILDQLEDKSDIRVHFIHQALHRIQSKLSELGSTLIVKYGKPENVWNDLLLEYNIKSVFTNHDYEPYAKERDELIRSLLFSKGIIFQTFKDQVIFEKEELLKDDGTPYVVWTPYSRKWKEKLNNFYLESYPVKKYEGNYLSKSPVSIPELKDMGFEKTDAQFPPDFVDDDLILNYYKTRDIPGINGTSRLSVHLRFGTISIRELTRHAKSLSEKFLNELIWREFYQMILWHFPQVIHHSFRREYDLIAWRNNETEFEKWCNGETGFPIVDAGMRELNATGFMHNRVRMIAAGFLTKDLLIDWGWGEAYFAKKLLDYDLASNNGGWQWAAGTGVDAAPYFRIFNPTEQAKKFDPEFNYIRKWVPEFTELTYPLPMLDHKQARERTLHAYKVALKRS